LLEVAPEIDTNPTSFYRGEGYGVGPVKVRLQTPVIIILYYAIYGSTQIQKKLKYI